MNFKRYLNENRTALNWNNINRVRLQKNSQPGFFLGYGRSPCALVSQRVNFPHTIYTSQNHKNHAGFSNFYNLEQKGLFFEKIRHLSPSGADYPSTIYTNQNHEYHAKILFFYKIEQKGLFVENFRGNSTNFDIFHWYHVHQ